MPNTPLQSEEPVTARNVDLTNCDRELIQFAGAIQPHCALLVLDGKTLEIVQASANTATLLGQSADSLVGQHVSAVLDSDQELLLRTRLPASTAPAPIHLMTTSRNGESFHVFAHRIDNLMMLEWEKSPPETGPRPEDLYAEVNNSLAGLRSAASLDEFFGLAVNQIRSFTGFERVLAYQFLPDKSGYVIAEARQEGTTSYLGHHYPASDIPEPARRMFSLLWLRYLPDVNYIPVPITPEKNPITHQPLDLSFVAGRSVSVMYSRYLQNMGVRSTMVITLLKDGKLWGLISCMHHSAPRHVPYHLRLACEFLGHMVSYLMAAKETEINRQNAAALREQVNRLTMQMSAQEPYYAGLLENPTTALSILESSGAAVVMEPDIHTLGSCPPLPQIKEIADWVDSSLGNESMFWTDRLSEHLSGALQFKDIASGLLAIRISRAPRRFALWFRPELAQSILWAGDPSKPVEVEDVRGETRLTPRGSFAAWKEEVKGRSKPWAEYEIEIMREFQRSIADVIAKQEDLWIRLNRELKVINAELDSFAYAASHDLKEPLRGIHNFATMVLRKSGASLDDESRARMHTIQRLTQRMDELIEALLHFSRVGKTDLALVKTDLNQTLAEAREMLAARFEETGARLEVPRPLPSIVCDPIRMQEVFSNLLSNALKFNDKPERRIEVGKTDVEPPVFWVRDNGIGIEAEYHEDIFQIFRRLHGRDELGGGSGAGLTIVRKIIERHGGRIWVESTPGEGSTFLFTIPSATQTAHEAYGANQ